MAEKVTLEKQLEMINDLATRIGSFNDRLRLIEERTHQNREKIRVVSDNLVLKFNEVKSNVKRLNIEVDELRKKVNDLTRTMQRMIKDLSNTAKLSDVKVIEKVLDFFDPTRFLTEKDLNKAIKDLRDK